MRVFIAGATRIGPRWASAASVSTLSASPCASLASVFAVSGAITSASARVRCGYEIVRRRPARKRVEGLGGDEALGARGDERHHLVPRPYEHAQELARLVGGDTTGDTEQDPRHGHIVPAAAPRKRYFFGYSYLILPWAISSRDMVK